MLETLESEKDCKNLWFLSMGADSENRLNIRYSYVLDNLQNQRMLSLESWPVGLRGPNIIPNHLAKRQILLSNSN